VPLESLQLRDFRCFAEAGLTLDPQLTLVTGPNGAGKSSILEAIYLLGRGRSFRTTHAAHLVHSGSTSARAIGTVLKDARTLPVGVELEGDRVYARIGGRPADTLAELSTVLPVQVIEPGIHKLIEEGPLHRRRFLDWGVFHVEPGYLRDWQRFHRAVRQRNAALRSSAPDEIVDPWDDEVATSGEAVARARASYVEVLRPYLLAATEALLGETITVGYSPGWSAEESLAKSLARGRERDRQRGTTMVGPHRSDLSIRRLAAPARQTVSRGQQKLLAAALVLGQLKYHAETQDLRVTLLLDDPAAELDSHRMERLVAQVRQLPVQLVITALQDDFRALGAAGRLFHVEPGGKVRLV
jgi:DNA replication and repair protein RecF